MNTTEVKKQLAELLEENNVIAVIGDPRINVEDIIVNSLKGNTNFTTVIQCGETDNLLNDINISYHKGEEVIILSDASILHSEYDIEAYNKLISVSKLKGLRIVFSLTDELILRELCLFEQEHHFWEWFNSLNIPKLHIV